MWSAANPSVSPVGVINASLEDDQQLSLATISSQSPILGRLDKALQ